MAAGIDWLSQRRVENWINWQLFEMFGGVIWHIEYKSRGHVAMWPRANSRQPKPANGKTWDN